MSTPEKAPVPPAKPASGTAASPAAPPRPATAASPAAAPPRPPPPRPSAASFPAIAPRPAAPKPADPPKAAAEAAKPADEAPRAAEAKPAEEPKAPEASAATMRASVPSSPALSGPVVPTAVAITHAPADAKPPERSGSAPRISDPDLAHLSKQIAGRDPEASLDIPPPVDVVPPEDRAPDAKDPYIGTTFDHRYKIEKLLGEGGMGFVYLARHKVIDKKVAVKVLRADLAKDREILERFLQEAKAASSIGNPHIVDISDFGDLPDGSTYFVMEFLEGKSLGSVVEDGARLPVERVCHVGLQICAGLSAAHARGIVHRDLKPDNIYLLERGIDRDFVKILDFGIAKVSGNANTKLTKAGAVFGTPHYMSPEQAAGSPVDHRTDIYALGVILYEMVSGQLPFNADNFMGILTQHMYKAPVPIRALVPGPECPPSLEAVILKCLSKKPEGRYQSMDELAADLDRVKSGGVANAVAEMMARSGGFNVPADYFKQPSVIVPATPPVPAKKWSRTVWIAGTVAAVGIVGVIFAISRPSNGTPAKDPPAPAVVTVVTVVQPAAPPPVKKTKPVAIGATPDNAQVYRDGALVHGVPCTIEVEEGQTVTVEVRAEHYETQTLKLDGSEDSKMVKLVPEKGYRPPVHPGVRPTGAGTGSSKSGGGKSSGGSDVRDPWGNK